MALKSERCHAREEYETCIEGPEELQRLLSARHHLKGVVVFHHDFFRP